MNYNLHNGYGYTYHMLDSIVPPSDDGQKKVCSLQNLCAERVVKLVPLNCQFLSKTPAHLHTVIWKAYLKHKYYLYADNFYVHKSPYQYLLEEKPDPALTFGTIGIPEIPELLYHWPQAVFSLKELMPKFPPRLHKFTSCTAPESPFTINRDCVLHFYKEVLTRVVNTFNSRYKKRAVKLHKDNWKLRKIDVTGFHGLELATYFEGSFKWCPIQCPTLDSIGKIEICIDAGIDFRIHLGSYGSMDYDDIVKHDKKKDILVPQCESSEKTVKFKIIGLNVCHDLSEYEEDSGYDGEDLGDIKLLERSIVGSGAKSLMLNFKCLPTFPKVLENAFEDGKNNENITGIILFKRGIDLFDDPNIEMDNGISTLRFVRRFPNLTHLSLQRICLHGRLDGLKTMHHGQGLVFLSLLECSLKCGDLHHLIESIHPSTLQELNLSENEFEYDKFSNKLIELCKSLTKVQMLTLKRCCLESWPSDKTLLLVDSLKTLPNIVYLDLSLNIFSSEQISHIMGLHINHSLRYLNLSFPRHIWDRYESATKSKGEKILKKYRATTNTNMNKERSQFLYVELGRFETDFW